MKVLITADSFFHSVDGRTTRRYVQGRIYELSVELGYEFIKDKLGIEPKEMQPMSKQEFDVVSAELAEKTAKIKAHQPFKNKAITNYKNKNRK